MDVADRPHVTVKKKKRALRERTVFVTVCTHAYLSWSPQVYFAYLKFQFHRLIDHDVSISNKNVQATYSIH